MRTSLIVLAMVASPAYAVPWLQPADAAELRAMVEIAPSAYFEVPASRLGAALHGLDAAAFVPEDEDVFEYFGRPDFRCRAHEKPYLLRAEYVHGGTGRFRIGWAASALVVRHASLGSDSPPVRRSALVACLDKRPLRVVSALSVAE